MSTNKIDKLNVDQETYLRENKKKEGKQQHKENKTNCRKVDSLKKKLASKALFFNDVLDLWSRKRRKSVGKNKYKNSKNLEKSAHN